MEGGSDDPSPSLETGFVALAEAAQGRARSLGLLLVLFPFVVSLVVDGQGPAAVWQNSRGNARFLQGLAIEIFILGLFAISYDLLLGVIGVISFGHAMFFAVGAYGFGIMLKSFELHWVVALLVVVLLAVLQALFFAILLPRVKGLTFALVTLGIAAVFWIVIRSSDLAQWAGAEIGLQGVNPPVWFLDTTNQRFVFYLLTAAIMLVVYVAVHQDRRFPDGPRAGLDPRERGPGTDARVQHLLVQDHGPDRLVDDGGPGRCAPHDAPADRDAERGQPHLHGDRAADRADRRSRDHQWCPGRSGRLPACSSTTWTSGSGAHPGLLIGGVYVLLVLYLPYGIVGTWRAKKAPVSLKEGRERLATLFEKALSRS